MNKRMVIAGLALVGVFLATYLTLFKLGMIGELACGTGSCETVQLSRWGTFLGLPVAAWGVGFYLAVLVIAIAGTTERYMDAPGLSTVLVALTAWGVAFSAWLSYLEARVINAWCRWCLGSAALVLLLFVLSVMDWRQVARLRDAERATD